MKQQEVNHNFYFVASTEKRLFWKTDKEQILHILSRVNIKYLRSLIKQCQNIQNDSDYLNGRDSLLVIVSPELRNEFIENHNKLYTNTKVWCKYDGYIFEVSFKTLKDELKRSINYGNK